MIICVLKHWCWPEAHRSHPQPKLRLVRHTTDLQRTLLAFSASTFFLLSSLILFMCWELLVPYVFSFTLRLENVQTVKGAG